MSNHNPSPNFGSLKAAGQRDTSDWLLTVVIPQLRRYARKHGTVETSQKFAHVEGSLKIILGEGLKIGGSHVRVGQIFGEQHLKLLVRVRRARVGAAAAISGPATNLYAVDLSREYTRREVEEAVLAVALKAEQHRRDRELQRRQEERLAGEYDTEATGTEVEEHHFHENKLDHPHGTRAGLHWHVELDGDPCWVEYRHHTHERRPTDDENGTRQQIVTERRHGAPREGRATDVTSTVKDGRYRALLDIITDLEATVRRRDSKIEQLELQNAALLEENLEYERELRRRREAEDPTPAEADDVLTRYGKET